MHHLMLSRHSDAGAQEAALCMCKVSAEGSITGQEGCAAPEQDCCYCLRRALWMGTSHIRRHGHSPWQLWPRTVLAPAPCSMSSAQPHLPSSQQP
jgi:hypothetical protein